MNPSPTPSAPDTGKAADGYVPMHLWAKDHWATLAYLETVMVECAGFQVGADARMKSNRRHLRVMLKECARPRRPGGGTGAMAVSMQPHHATRLKDGSQPAGHDDWMCVQDMAAEGLFTCPVDDVEPRAVLHLSDRGRALAQALRQHKAAGGSFAEFNGAISP